MTDAVKQTRKSTDDEVAGPPQQHGGQEDTDEDTGVSSDEHHSDTSPDDSYTPVHSSPADSETVPPPTAATSEGRSVIRDVRRSVVQLGMILSVIIFPPFAIIFQCLVKLITAVSAVTVPLLLVIIDLVGLIASAVKYVSTEAVKCFKRLCTFVFQYCLVKIIAGMRFVILHPVVVISHLMKPVVNVFKYLYTLVFKYCPPLVDAFYRLVKTIRDICAVTVPLVVGFIGRIIRVVKYVNQFVLRCYLNVLSLVLGALNVGQQKSKSPSSTPELHSRSD